MSRVCRSVTGYKCAFFFQNATDGPVPILLFPKKVAGLRRSKRDWVIPDIKVSENVRGPYPFKVSQVSGT